MMILGWGECLFFYGRYQGEKVNWNKVTKEHIEEYQSLLLNDSDMLNLSKNIPDQHDINVYCKKLCDSLNTCASDTFPKSCHKSYGNDQFNDAHDVMWRYCEQWRAEGRPRDINSSNYLNYKKAKTIFRRTYQCTSGDQYICTYQNLDRKLEEQTKSDCVGFWRQLNSRK
ncbi:hypothetical protein ACF0H5_017884 [Mactra antiquata]